MSLHGKPTCTLLFILTLSLLALYTTHLHHRHPPSSAAKNYRNTLLYYRNTFLSAASNYTVSAYLRHLTLRPHLAGTPLSLSAAVYVQTQFQSLGLTTHVTNFSALLSYPARSSLSAHFSNGTVLPIPLSEPNAAGNGVVMPYHAYSPSGAAYGEAVFLNYGRGQDYRALGAQGVEVKGCVGLVRRGSGMSRHEVVASAAAHGVSAVLMYTEGEFKEGVERGTVMNGLGDPLSPGWAGIDGGEKLDLNDPRVTEKFPGVPSLPVSEAAAESILASLEGARVPYEWRESFKSGARRIRRVGPGPILLNFTYEGELKMATIHNVFAVIKGSDEPDRLVLLGNHRDAWTYGAVDPNSGTAALLDIARRFALLMRLGWNPRRTIVLCSWDAEEFGMVKDPDSENARLYERWTAANNGVDEYKNVLNTLLEETISLHPIAAAIQEFIIAANETEEEIKKLRLNNNLDESTVLRRRMLNDRLMLTEAGFLDLEGLLEGNGSSIS
ncbi:hypothetical protein DH2020_014863 [Rehmannia glutinosa]|uniref:Uncharacterized protein n=1 Tax=Rehmannia glutinosa TaxID=99300 RepID=A0ABR0WXP4_REHGL